MTKLDKSPFNLDRIAKAKQWYRIENKKSDKAKLYLMDEISFWGITAQDFVNDLQEIEAKEIELHINSPGGDAWDGIAIHNALVDHNAKITVFVDGIAASAASVIAMAGEEVVMAAGATLMIHDASGLVWGNAQDMKKMASVLDKLSDQIAGFYAAKTGGSVTEWRDAMKDESWYTDKEAVEAGLADRALKGDDEDETKAKNLANRFDLSVFNHAGRSSAPEPAMNKADLDNKAGRYPGISSNSAQPNASFDNKEKTGTDTFAVNTQEEKPLTADQLEKLGLPEGATQEQIDERLDALAALESGGDGETDQSDDTDGDAGSGTDESGETTKSDSDKGDADSAPTNKLKMPEGVVAIDAKALADLQAAAGEVRSIREEQRIERRDTFLNKALGEGKFPPASLSTWKANYDNDEKSTIEFVENKLKAGTIPLEEIGHGKETIENKVDDEYPADWGRSLISQGEGQ